MSYTINTVVSRPIHYSRQFYIVTLTVVPVLYQVYLPLYLHCRYYFSLIVFTTHCMDEIVLVDSVCELVEAD